jgi:hypothetical protein
MARGRFLALVAVSALIAIVVGIRFAYILMKPPAPQISSSGYEIRKVGGKYLVIFSGNVVNPSNLKVYDVTVYVYWTEMGGRSQIDSICIGDMAPRSTVPFEVIYECQYNVTLGSSRFQVEYSETP